QAKWSTKAPRGDGGPVRLLAVGTSRDVGLMTSTVTDPNWLTTTWSLIGSKRPPPLMSYEARCAGWSGAVGSSSVLFAGGRRSVRTHPPSASRTDRRA